MLMLVPPQLPSLRRLQPCLCLCPSPPPGSTGRVRDLRLGDLLGMDMALTQTVRATCAVNMADMVFVHQLTTADGPDNLVKTLFVLTSASSLVT